MTPAANPAATRWRMLGWVLVLVAAGAALAGAWALVVEVQVQFIGAPGYDCGTAATPSPNAGMGATACVRLIAEQVAAAWTWGAAAAAAGLAGAVLLVRTPRSGPAAREATTIES